VFVGLTRVQTGDQPIATASIVGEEMARWFRGVEGFMGFLMVSREGTTIGLSFWESRDAALRNRVSRAQFVERISSVVEVEIEERAEYEVMYADLPALKAEESS
jgi:hypothetical protein